MLLQQQNNGRSPRRAGAVSVYLLLALPIMLLALGLAIWTAQVHHAKTTSRNAGDAAALAAVAALADDSSLLQTREVMLALFDEARKEAIRFARENPSLGEPTDLDLNLDNEGDGDIVFGSLETPRSKDFVVADVKDKHNKFLHLVNTVRITVLHTSERKNAAELRGNGPYLSAIPTDLVTFSTATLDRDVIGFRPLFQNKPLPIAPLALLSDPKGTTKESWEFQVEKKQGKDAYRYDRVERKVKPTKDGDGIHEMEVRVTTKSSQEGQRRNVCLLKIGIQNGDDFLQQLRVGVHPDHLQGGDFNGSFVLKPDNTLIVPGGPWGSGVLDVKEEGLKASLEQLQTTGEVRIWPLFSGFDPNQSRPIVNGFVAARVASVSSGEGGLSFVLQPCVILAPFSVTDATRRTVPGRSIVNPYICKARLVE